MDFDTGVDANLENYEVLKMEDIIEYCTEDQKAVLQLIVETVYNGRLNDGKCLANQYYVVDVDEPWAREVKQIMDEHGLEGNDKNFYERDFDREDCE